MHYRNGREAKVGDPVVGRTYNRKGLQAGTLVSVTPGPDTCSAMVAVIVVKPGATPLAWGTNKPVHVMGVSHHGSQEPLAAQVHDMDYTECKNLLHADDVASVGALLAEAA
jgi:hypothetical protein